MARYFAIATVIVLGLFLAIGFWWSHFPHKTLTIASTNTTMPPRPGPAQNIDYTANNRPFIATAPWALSVLPECLEQTLSAHGNTAYVTTKLPTNAQLIPAPATLHYADCTIHIKPTTALITRGPDRLTIPPTVRFYKNSGNELFVLREDLQGAELRVYVPALK